MARKKKQLLTLTLKFDMAADPDRFGKFCEAMIKGGFEDFVQAMAKEILDEARRRKLPVVDELGLGGEKC